MNAYSDLYLLSISTKKLLLKTRSEKKLDLLDSDCGSSRPPLHRL